MEWPSLKTDKAVVSSPCLCDCPEGPCTIPEYLIPLMGKDAVLGGVRVYEGQSDGFQMEHIVLVDLGENAVSPRGGGRQVGQLVLRARYRGAKGRVAEMAQAFRKLVNNKEFCVSNYGWLKVRSVVRTGINKSTDSASWEQVDNFQLMTMG